MELAVVFSEHPIRDGRRIGVAHLNAPRTLNALSLEMIRLLTLQLERWAEDVEIAAVWLEGEGDKAFCAGGDVLDLYRVIAEGKPEDGEAFFAEEYRLDYQVHTYPKPVIAWGNGIVMGGGLGLMAGASFRVATENSHLAMPEVAIGLFPDVGASWFLNRMPRRTGLFLGLTGAPLNAADAIFLDLADRFITHDQRRATFTALTEADWKNTQPDAATVNHVLRSCEQKVAEQLPESRVRKHFDLIQSLSDTDDLADMVTKVSAYRGEDAWLKKAAQNAAYGSPSSMAIFYRQLGRAKYASLAEALQQELILAANALRAGEFAEGIRALLVDKDRQPRWRYAKASELDPRWIGHFFESPWPNGNTEPFLQGSAPFERET